MKSRKSSEVLLTSIVNLVFVDILADLRRMTTACRSIPCIGTRHLAYSNVQQLILGAASSVLAPTELRDIRKILEEQNLAEL
jgi:hypothetical protein